MFKKLLFLYVLLHFLSLSVFALDKSYCKCRSKVSSRIIGGRIAKQNAFPWQISLGVLPVGSAVLSEKKFLLASSIEVKIGAKNCAKICVKILAGFCRLLQRES